MAEIKLGYGNSQVSLEFDEARFAVLGGTRVLPALSDVEIGAALDSPTGSPPLEDIVGAGESVLLVVPDATRATASGQIVNLLTRRLIANGTAPFDIRIIFATGIHRAVTAEEKKDLLTPFITQRIKTLDHNPRDLTQLARVGETPRGAVVELNRALLEHDHVIIIGGVTWHYFAGFTSGRKLICPGLAASKTINQTHKPAFDCETHERREGVGVGRLDGNVVHEEFEAAAGLTNISFAVNTIVDDAGRAARVFAGDWRASHRAACKFYAANFSLPITEKRDAVIVSCGGAPHDINLIQAHKALEMASYACKEGGTIVWLAECRDGFGRKDFPDWFAAGTSRELAKRLCEKYQVNGQTAWTLLDKAERFRVVLISALPEEKTRRMKLHTARDLESALAEISPASTGYILPYGAKYLLGM
jgi:nickel-dependent lactate racemase